jgi:hypothetical protein
MSGCLPYYICFTGIRILAEIDCGFSLELRMFSFTYNVKKASFLIRSELLTAHLVHMQHRGIIYVIVPKKLFYLHYYVHCRK